MWFKKRLNSFRYAFIGVADLFRSQPNAKVHFVAAVGVIAAGFFFQISMEEWCLIALAISGVLAAEASNTALEYLTDLVSPNFHPLAGKAKDAAAGGVLLMAIGAAVVGCLIFLPKLIAFFTP